VNYMAMTYKWGWHGIRADQDVSQCFADARVNLSDETHADSQRLAACKQMELALGYSVQH